MSYFVCVSARTDIIAEVSLRTATNPAITVGDNPEYISNQKIAPSRSFLPTANALRKPGHVVGGYYSWRHSSFVSLWIKTKKAREKGTPLRRPVTLKLCVT